MHQRVGYSVYGDLHLTLYYISCVVIWMDLLHEPVTGPVENMLDVFSIRNRLFRPRPGDNPRNLR
jgi:hypothetical protein